MIDEIKVAIIYKTESESPIREKRSATPESTRDIYEDGSLYLVCNGFCASGRGEGTERQVQL